MEYRTLGKTGLQVSPFAVGTWQLSGPSRLGESADGYPDPGEQSAVDLVRRCGELGINLIDTAPAYGNGEGERRVGRAIRGRRDHWIVSTKFGWQEGAGGEREVDLSAIRPQLEESLARLGTDYVDLYLYHCPPDPSRIEAVRDQLEELKREGKLRFHGVSTRDATALRSVAEAGSADVAIIAQSLLTRPEATLQLVEQHELGTLVRGALEWGRLSGHYFDAKAGVDRGSLFASDDIRREKFQHEDLCRYAGFRDLVPEGATMAQFALRYVLDFRTTHSVILGGKTLAQYQEAVGALELESLRPKTLAEVSKLDGRLSGQGALRRLYRAARSLIQAG